MHMQGPSLARRVALHAYMYLYTPLFNRAPTSAFSWRLSLIHFHPMQIRDDGFPTETIKSLQRVLDIQTAAAYSECLLKFHEMLNCQD